MRVYQGVFVVLMGVLISACQTILPTSSQAVSPAGASLCVVSDVDVCQKNWWYVFDDDVLNRYMNRLVAENAELAVATLTLQKAIINQQKTQDAKKIITTGQFRANQNGTHDPKAHVTARQRSMDVGIHASWEVDLWGKLQLQQTMSKQETNAATYDRQAIFLSLTATAVQNYFSLIAINQKHQHTSQSLYNQQRQLSYLRSQQSIGLIAPADLLTVQQSINTLHQNLVALNTQKAEQLNTLALMLNTTSHHLPNEIKSQSKSPKLPDIFSQLPADIVANRPDLQAGLQRLSISLAQKNLITKNSRPSLVLSSGVAMQNARLLDLLKVPILNWGISFNFPAFNIKEHRHSLSLAKIDGQIATHQYQESVYRALSDTQNKLINWQNQQQNHRLLLQAQSLSKKQLDNQYQRHRIGLISTKELEESKESHHQAQMSVIDGFANQAQGFVSLYQAIGGIDF